LLVVLSLGGGQAQAPSTPKTAPQTLNLLNWDSYLDPALVRRFEAQEKVKVVQTIADGNEAFLALLKKRGPGKFDVVFPSSDFVKLMAEQNLIVPLERALLPNFKNLLPSFVGRSFDPDNLYSVPYLWGTEGLFYNSQTVKGEVDSWAALFGPKAQNRFVLLDNARDTFSAALKYTRSSLNPKTRAPLERARDVLLGAVARPQFRGFAQDTSPREKVLRGEADIAVVYVGDGIQGMQKDSRMRFVLPKEGSSLFLDNMVIASGAPQRGLAHRFINFMLEAKNAAQNATALGYPTPNQAALALISPQLRDNPNIYPNADGFAKLEFQLETGKLNPVYLNFWTQVRRAATVKN